MRKLAVIAVLAVSLLPSAAGASNDDKTRQHLRELEGLTARQNECLAAISNAERNGNVWQDDNVSMQDCRDVAMKLIQNGSKLIQDGTEESDSD